MSTRNQVTARFWCFPNGEDPVRLALIDGQSISWDSGRIATDEGWTLYGVTYRREGRTIYREQWSDGADCDGRYAVDECDTATIDDLASCATPSGLMVPDWKRLAACHRDYTAESAGY